MRQRDTGGLQFVEAFQYRIAQHYPHFQLDARFFQRVQQHLARRHGVQTTGIEDELHPAWDGYRKQVEQHGGEVARVAQAGVALAVLLQDGQRQFGQVIRCHVLNVASLDAGFDGQPGVAVKAEPPGYTHRFHGYYLIPSNSLAINNWRISLVPAPISPSLALRHIFSTSKSVR